ncbi:GNAT family N-acetyltransferase [Periweissella cryptocerci]|nr:GNAT family N-acetyltransferase [Periweissella cryptocerci]
MVVTLKAITTEQQAEVLQLAQASADFFAEFGGGPVTAANVGEFFTKLPAGKENTDKHTFFIMADDEPVGFIDLISGYPRPHTWYIGLFFITPEERGAGIGRQAFAMLSNFARKQGANKLRLAAAKENENGLKFWQKNAFVITQYLEDFKIDGVAVPTYVLEKEVWVDVFVG